MRVNHLVLSLPVKRSADRLAPPPGATAHLCNAQFIRDRQLADLLPLFTNDSDLVRQSGRRYQALSNPPSLGDSVAGPIRRLSRACLGAGVRITVQSFNPEFPRLLRILFPSLAAENFGPSAGGPRPMMLSTTTTPKPITKPIIMRVSAFDKIVGPRAGRHGPVIASRLSQPPQLQMR